MQRRVKRNPKVKAKKSSGRFPRNSGALVPIPPRPSSLNSVPRYLRTNLTWAYNASLTNSASLGANSYVNLVDLNTPALVGSSTPSGFAALKTLYWNARVLSARIQFIADNREAFTLLMFLLPVSQSGDGNAPPANNDITSATDLRAVSGNRMFRQKIIAPAGAVSTGKLVWNVNLDGHLGLPWSGTVDKYCMGGNGTTGCTQPDASVYAAFGIFSANATSTLTATTGVSYEIRVIYDTVFFGIRQVSS